MSHTFRSNTPAERKLEVLKRLEVGGLSSPDQRRRGKGLILGALAAVSLGVVAHEPISDALTEIGHRIDQNYDYHNLPPDGQPVPNDGVAPINDAPANSNLVNSKGMLPPQENQLP
jgi:hypothetical protein